MVSAMANSITIAEMTEKGAEVKRRTFSHFVVIEAKLVGRAQMPRIYRFKQYAGSGLFTPHTGTLKEVYNLKRDFWTARLTITGVNRLSKSTLDQLPHARDSAVPHTFTSISPSEPIFGPTWYKQLFFRSSAESLGKLRFGELPKSMV